MPDKSADGSPVSNGDKCMVTSGVHAGKSGEVQDLKLSKTGHATITVAPADGPRFKTLARNVKKLS